MQAIEENLTKAITILQSRGVQIRHVELLKRQGNEVYTIYGKENGRVSTFQLNSVALLYFDRSKKDVVEKVVHRFYNGSLKEQMQEALEKSK